MVCKINHSKHVRCKSEIKDKALDPNSFLTLSYNCNRHTLAGLGKIEAFPLDKQLSHFSCPGSFLACLS